MLTVSDLEGPTPVIFLVTIDGPIKVLKIWSKFRLFRACLEKMLRSHVQHLQEELAHMERTTAAAASSSRHLLGGNINQGRDRIIQWHWRSWFKSFYFSTCGVWINFFSKITAWIFCLLVEEADLVCNLESWFKGKKKWSSPSSRESYLSYSLFVHSLILQDHRPPLLHRGRHCWGSGWRTCWRRWTRWRGTTRSGRGTPTTSSRTSRGRTGEIKWGCGNCISQALKFARRWRCVERKVRSNFQWHLNCQKSLYLQVFRCTVELTLALEVSLMEVFL